MTGRFAVRCVEIEVCVERAADGPAYEIARDGDRWRWRPLPEGAWSRPYASEAAARTGALHTLRWRAHKSTRKGGAR